ncbi:hypothetical protein MAR_008909 [Mya arenaria]|uniref:Uncharacterized protein n=1 Tax=Mya arenaria TaxID=6604 RepID=A0ABY7E5C8_MYAAR|nr:hypothetical protein MAR_008909 [Mya arenaria]
MSVRSISPRASTPDSVVEKLWKIRRDTSKASLKVSKPFSQLVELERMKYELIHLHHRKYKFYTLSARYEHNQKRYFVSFCNNVTKIRTQHRRPNRQYSRQGRSTRYRRKLGNYPLC